MSADSTRMRLPPALRQSWFHRRSLPLEKHSYNRDRSLVHQRQLNEDTHSFANALRAALREDPDVILVGEMRDLETI